MARVTSQGFRYLMMFTVEIIGPNAELATYTVRNGKLGLSPLTKLTPVLAVVWHFTLLSTRCRLHLGQWQRNRFTNGQASQLVRLEFPTLPYMSVIPCKRSVPLILLSSVLGTIDTTLMGRDIAHCEMLCRDLYPILIRYWRTFRVN